MIVNKNIKKGILSLCVVTTLSTNIAIPTYAAVSEVTQKVVLLQNADFQQEYQKQLKRFSTMSDEEVCEVLINEYGLSREQVSLIYQEYLTAQSIALYGFPSNPTEGQTYSYTTKKIALPSDPDKKLMQIMSACAAIPNPYVSAFGGAAAMAAAIFGLCPSNAKYVVATFNYTYGMTNDGVLGWTPGYIDTKFYY